MYADNGRVRESWNEIQNCWDHMPEDANEDEYFGVRIEEQLVDSNEEKNAQHSVIRLFLL